MNKSDVLHCELSLMISLSLDNGVGMPPRYATFYVLGYSINHYELYFV